MFHRVNEGSGKEVDWPAQGHTTRHWQSQDEGCCVLSPSQHAISSSPSSPDNFPSPAQSRLLRTEGSRGQNVFSESGSHCLAGGKADLMSQSLQFHSNLRLQVPPLPLLGGEPSWARCHPAPSTPARECSGSGSKVKNKGLWLVGLSGQDAYKKPFPLCLT